MTDTARIRVRPPQGWRELPRVEGELIAWAQAMFEELDVVPSLRRRSFASLFATFRWASTKPAHSAWVLLDDDRTGFVRASSRVTMVALRERSAAWLDESLSDDSPGTLLSSRRSVPGGEVVERARLVDVDAESGMNIVRSHYWGFLIPTGLSWCVQLEMSTHDAKLYESIVSMGGAVLESITIDTDGGP